jgi:carbamoyl-phosphate synthase large subunit
VKSACTILISSAGRRVELIRCFRDGAARIGIDLRVIAVDVDPAMSAACHLADVALRVPRCDRAEFIEDLLGICLQHEVDLIVPTIDPELEPLSAHAARFGEIGVDLAVAAPEVVRLARDKLRTAHFLASRGVPAPRSSRLDEVTADPGAWPWPLMIKPRSGSSSVGIRILSSADQLAEFEESSEYLAQELLRGEEYTVNMFFDRAGRLLCTVPHLRCEVRAGEVAKGITRRHPGLEAIASRLGEVLPGARGALCFQAMVDQAGHAVVFELNARFGGGYPLAHQAGARFAQWLLEETTGRPVSAHNHWQDGVLMLRYDHAVFCAAPGDR